MEIVFWSVTSFVVGFITCLILTMTREKKGNQYDGRNGNGYQPLPPSEEYTVPENLDLYEIPAFLRRQAD